MKLKLGWLIPIFALLVLAFIYRPQERINIATSAPPAYTHDITLFILVIIFSFLSYFLIRGKVLRSLKPLLSKHSTAIILLILTFLAFISFRNILSQNGVIALHHDWVFPQTAPELNYHTSQYFTPWFTPGLGEYRSYTTAFIFNLFSWFASGLGAGGAFLSKFFSISLLLLSGLSFYLLSKSFTKNKIACLLASLLYILNPVLYNRIVAGHFGFIIGYALAPLCLLLFKKSVTKNGFNYSTILIGALLFSIAGQQIQLTIMIFLILFLYSLFEKKKKLFLVLILYLITYFLVHSPWILNLLFQDISSVVSHAGGTSTEWISELSPSLTESLFLIGYRHFMFSLLETSNLYVWGFSFLIIILTALARLIFKKDRVYYFALTIWILGLIISTGISPPFGFIYENMPFNFLFREVYHLMFLTAFGFCLTFLLSYSHVINYFRRYKLFIAPLTLGLILIISFPFFTGDFAGRVQVVDFDRTLIHLAESLDKDLSDYRVLYTPLTQPIKYKNYTYVGIDPIVAFSPKDTFDQIIYSSEPRHKFTAFVINLLHEPITNHLGFILGLAGVRNIYERFDFYSDFPNHSYMGDFPQSLSFNNDWINLVLSNQADLNLTKCTFINYYDNLAFLPRVYAVDSSFLASGGLSSLVSFSYINDLLNYSKPAFFFAAQEPNFNVDYLLVNEEYLDFVISLIHDEYKFDPASFVTSGDARKSWTPLYGYDFGWWWYNTYYSQGLEDSIFTLSNKSISFPISTTKDSYLLIKYLSTDGIIINFNGTEHIINPSERFTWDKILISSDSNLTITPLSGENIISRIALVPVNVFNNAYSEFINYSSSKSIISYSELGEISCDIPEKVFSFEGVGVNLHGCGDKCDLKGTFNKEYIEGNFSTYFFNNASVDEFAVVFKSINVSLLDYPYLEVISAVNNPEIQTIEVAFTTDDEKIIDVGWSVYTSSDYNSYIYNLKQAVIDNNASALNLTKLGIRVHKKIGKNAEPGYYEFRIKSVKFFNPEMNFNSSNGCFLNSSFINQSLFIPKQGDYSIFLRRDSEWVNINSSFLHNGINDFIFEFNESGINDLLVAVSDFKELLNNSVFYERIDSSHVNITYEFSNPGYLVFSETYHPSWMLNDSSPLIANSFAQAYLLNDSNNFQLVFTKADTYSIGLLISFITLTISLVIILLLFIIYIKSIDFKEHQNYAFCIKKSKAIIKNVKKEFGWIGILILLSILFLFLGGLFLTIYSIVPHTTIGDASLLISNLFGNIIIYILIGIMIYKLIKNE